MRKIILAILLLPLFAGAQVQKKFSDFAVWPSNAVQDPYVVGYYGSTNYKFLFSNLPWLKKADTATMLSPLWTSLSGAFRLSQALGATSGQVLKWNGTAWAPAADNTGGGVPGAIYDSLNAHNDRIKLLDAQRAAMVVDIAGKAAASHTHTSASITDFGSAAASAAPVQSVAGKTGNVTLAKGDVGLGNVDNTTDLNKPVSTATQTALNGKANSSHTHSQSDVTNLTSDLAAKQATLVSGINIKTVNGTPLLGAGDIPIAGGGGSLMTSDFGSLPEIRQYYPAQGVSASNSYSANYPATSVDSAVYKFSTTRGGVAPSTEYGGWLTSNLTGDSIQLTAPFGVVIGDSQAEGHPATHGRLHPSGAATFNWTIPDVPGQISYHLQRLTKMRWYNHGIGGQTTTQVRLRFMRDVVGLTSDALDGRGTKTISRKAAVVVIIAGINDVFAGADPQAVKSNLEYMAGICLQYGIRCVVLNLPGDALANQAQARGIQTINKWLADGGLARYGATVVDYNSWWRDPLWQSDYKPNTALIADDIHPTAVGYDSLSNYIFRQAKLPVMSKIRLLAQRDPSGFTGFSRPTTVTIKGISVSLASDSSVVDVPDFMPDSAWVKITASTNVTGTTYTGISHVDWFLDNNPTGAVMYTQKPLQTGPSADGRFGKLEVQSPDFNTVNFASIKNYDGNTFMGWYGGGQPIIVAGTQTRLQNAYFTINGGGNYSLATSAPIYVPASGNGSWIGNIQIGNTASAGGTGWGIGLFNSQMNFEHNIAGGFRFGTYGGGVVNPSYTGGTNGIVNIAQPWGNFTGNNNQNYNLRLGHSINNANFVGGYNNTFGGIDYMPGITDRGNSYLVGLHITDGDNYLNNRSGSTIIGDSSKPKSAVLSLNSTNRGLLPPRMTTAQRDAIGYISAINISSGGTGYTTYPKITIAGAGANALAFGSNFSGSSISGATIVDAGYGWGGSTPTVTFVGGGGTGAAATATVSGPEAGLIIFNTTDNVLQFYNGTTWVSVGKNITGTATLSAGTVTVATTSVTATSKVFVTVVTPGGTQGFISVPTITAGTSFVINSTSASETSTVNWWVVN